MTVVGANTLASITFNNQGAMATPTVAVGAGVVNTPGLTLSAANAITATNDTLSTTPVISGAGGLALSNAAPVINVSGSSTNSLQITAPINSANPVTQAGTGALSLNPTFTAGGGASTATNATLTVTSTVGMQVGMAISGTGLPAGESIASIPDATHIVITTGTGVTAGTAVTYTLLGSTFTAGYNLNSGSLIFGQSTNPTTGTVLAGPVGTGTLTISNLGTSTTVLSDSNRTIGNATTVSGDFVFGGVTASNNLNLSGAMNLGATGRTITVTSPGVTGTISGAITSTATGTALTKAGNGMLVLSNATSNLGGAGITVAGGILKNGIDNAIPNTTPLAVNAGAGYDLNAFNEVIQVITGSGFITNSGAAKTLSIGTSTTDVTSTVDNVFSGAFVSGSLNSLVVNKLGLGTLTLTHGGVSPYLGAVATNGANLTVVAGSVVGAAENAFPSNGTATVGTALTGSNSLTATLDTGAFNQTLTNLVAAPNTATSAATINIGTGKTLTVNGNMTLGSNTSATDTTNVNFTGGGALLVSNTAGTVLVGAAVGGTNFDTVTVNMGSLASFTVNHGTAGTGTFRVGDAATGTNTTIQTVNLAPISSITTGTFGWVMSRVKAAVPRVRRWSIWVPTSTVINANTINIGEAGADTGRGSGLLQFGGATGTLTIRSSNGSTGTANLNMINNTGPPRRPSWTPGCSSRVIRWISR